MRAQLIHRTIFGLIILSFVGQKSYSMDHDTKTTAPSTAVLRSNSPEFSHVLHWRGEGVDFVEVLMRSQTFKGSAWDHALLLAKPREQLAAKVALTIIGGGNSVNVLPTISRPFSSKDTIKRLAHMAKEGHILAFSIEQIPFQPIFDGKTEDEAISHTFKQFFATGDPSWPLLNPMVQAVVKGLDAFSVIAEQEWHIKPQGFVLTGESKRGWTTWLTAAVDQRVKGIVPIVFDMLNIKTQLVHQLNSWGAYSPEIGDYSGQGLPELLDSPRGAQLLKLIDPFQKRSTLTMPKIIILGTNDPYWPIGAATNYFDALQGPKYLLYCPNAAHEIADKKTIDQERMALTLATGGLFSLPDITSTLTELANSKDVLLEVHSSAVPDSTTLWQAESNSRDFRKAIWTETRSLENRKDYQFTLGQKNSKYSASFIKLKFTVHGLPFYATSKLGITSPIPNFKKP